MSQFYLNGIATQAEIIRAFGVSSITMKRAVKTFRTRGPEGFLIEIHLNASLEY